MAKRNGAGSIYKRGNIWWVQVWVDGRPIAQSSKSTDLNEAKKFRTKLLASKVRGDIGGSPERVLVGELLNDVLKTDIAESTRYIWSKVVEKHIRPFFGHIRAARLSTDLLQQYRDQRTGSGASESTANRELSVLRTAIHNGRKHTPAKVLHVPHFPMRKEETVRQGFLSDAEYGKLRDALDEDVRLVFVVAYATGTRKGELLQAEWSWVDLDRNRLYIPREVTKNGKGRTLPILSGDMRDMLVAAKQKRDSDWPDSPWVFSRQGIRIRDFRTAWSKARKAAGVPDLLPHDLRRTAVRNMRRAGVPQALRMQISGHVTDSMERRYNIVDDDDVEMAMHLMSAFKGDKQA